MSRKLFKSFVTENEEQLDEVLSKSDPASKWIHDFVKSDNPKFKGKSKKERIQMALGAYYAKQRNEEVESIDEISQQTKASYTAKAKAQVKELTPFTQKKSEYHDLAKNLIAKRTAGIAKANEELQGVAEGYWQDALKKAEVDREARKGKPFEKNPASHDKDGVYKGDKDLAGNPVPKRKEQGVVEGLNEMDKSQTPPGRDGGHQFPEPKVSKKDRDAVKKDPAKHLSDLFAKYDKKKKGVAEDKVIESSARERL